MKRFEGKAALVTGAASGIGLATARRLASEGARVLACDVNAAALEKEVASLTAEGLDVTARRLDVTRSDDCNGSVHDAASRFGRLDALCNVAGVLSFGHFTEISDAEWSRIFAVNVHGVVAMCRAAIPHLLETRGSIVNISSAAGLAGTPYNAAYSASKAAVHVLSKTLAVEYASRGLRVNAVCPGHVLTPMTQDAMPPADADWGVFGRLAPLVTPSASPDEVAGALAYLCSDEARFVTGSTFVIDGGQTAI